MQAFAFYLSEGQPSVEALMAERLLHISALSCSWAMPVFWAAGRKGRRGGEAARPVRLSWGAQAPGGLSRELPRPEIWVPAGALASCQGRCV